MPAASSSASGNPLIDTLLSGTEWTGSLAWSLGPSPGAEYLTSATTTPPDKLETALAGIFGAVASFTKLDLEKGGADAALRVFTADWMSYGDPSAPTTVELGGYAFFPGGNARAGDIWLGPSVVHDLTPGTYGYRTLLHEVGHALGLKQPDEAGPFGTLAPMMDGAEWSVMSARGVPGAALSAGLGIEPSGYAEGFMVRDIAALQHLYGADYSVRSNDTYVFDPMERVIARTIWDGGGRDTYDFSQYTTALTINLQPGGWSVTGQEAQLNRADEIATGAAPIYAAGSVYNAELHNGNWLSGIENAIGGSASDVIRGNVLENRLAGGAGDDILSGFGGRDVLLGGDGNDALNGGGRDDRLLGGAGNDLLRGGSGADRLFGHSGDDLISAARGDDRLIGAAGADTLSGGAGDDKLNGGSGEDVFTGGSGHDVFVARGPTGHDLITDFAAGVDRIDVDDPLAAYASAVADGADTLITVGTAGDVLRLAGLAPSMLSPDDFF